MTYSEIEKIIVRVITQELKIGGSANYAKLLAPKITAEIRKAEKNSK